MKGASVAEQFLVQYETDYSSLVGAVDLLRQQVVAQLRDGAIPVSAVYGRAKTIDSVRGKLLKKSYRNPTLEMTDQVGLRVVVLHAFEVDHAVAVLSRCWSVMAESSVDKRNALALREFGYRSVHLVCTIPQQVCDKARLNAVGRTFEIQIRSLLEHAWAEIEHGVVYKAGAQLPDKLKRRFASLAAVAELMESEFERLGEETKRLADIEKDRVFAEGFGELPVDVPRLIAVLETYRPTGASLRSPDNATLSLSTLSRIVDALHLCGINSNIDLARSLLSDNLQASVREFATAQLIGEDAVSHLAICFLLLGTQNASVLKTFFPEFASSTGLREVFDGPANRLAAAKRPLRGVRKKGRR